MHVASSGGIVMVTATGEPLDTQVPDDTLLVGYASRSAERPPQFVMHPESPVPLKIKQTQVPEVLLPGSDIVAQPSKWVNNWVLMDGLTCPGCQDLQTKDGYELDTPPELPDFVVQCRSCRSYLWVQKKR
jgi:hypothetical protein